MRVNAARAAVLKNWARQLKTLALYSTGAKLVSHQDSKHDWYLGIMVKIEGTTKFTPYFPLNGYLEARFADVFLNIAMDWSPLDDPFDMPTWEEEPPKPRRRVRKKKQYWILKSEVLF